MSQLTMGLCAHACVHEYRCPVPDSPGHRVIGTYKALHLNAGN